MEKISRKYFYFLVITLFGFIFSIAFTSLEIRHFGTFYLPFLILISSFEKENLFEKRNYQKYLFGHIILVILIHLSWALIKFIF
jgi:apolipoprotein N-acyltransferase